MSSFFLACLYETSAIGHSLAESSHRLNGWPPETRRIQAQTVLKFREGSKAIGRRVSRSQMIVPYFFCFLQAQSSMPTSEGQTSFDDVVSVSIV